MSVLIFLVNIVEAVLLICGVLYIISIYNNVNSDKK